MIRVFHKMMRWKANLQPTGGAIAMAAIAISPSASLPPHNHARVNIRSSCQFEVRLRNLPEKLMNDFKSRVPAWGDVDE